MRITVREDVDAAVYTYLKSINDKSSKAGHVHRKSPERWRGLAPFHDWTARFRKL